MEERNGEIKFLKILLRAKDEFTVSRVYFSLLLLLLILILMLILLNMKHASYRND